MLFYEQIILILCVIQAQGQFGTSSSSTTLHRAQFTVPASANVGLPLLPNVDDPDAVDAQTICPGYFASNVINDQYGFSATLTLAGKNCNVYGTDIEELQLRVQYQSQNRLSVNIFPSYLVSSKVLAISIIC
jgi:alpha-glucosidase